MDFPSSSPPLPSESFTEELDTYSLQDKELYDNSLLKHNNNNVNKYMGNGVGGPPGTRGRKTFAFWILVGLLFTLAIGNLILTITILSVLKLGHGMQNFEIIDQENISNFYGDIDLDHLYNREGTFRGFSGDTVDISSMDSSVIFSLLSNPTGGFPTTLKIFKNLTVLKGVNTFVIKTPDGTSIFTTTEPTFESLGTAKSFTTKQLETSQIKSAIDEDLNIESKSFINLKGTEGTKIESREIVWSADQDIYLKTVNGCIILSGEDGVYIDMNRIPVAQLRNNTIKTGQYKVCVCMPEGKLFRIPIVSTHETVFCDDVDIGTTGSPCALKE
ncbi:unnamed protein product [Brassicogethes aeneus]|uniref:Beta-sarcoglycan n=1 Tax=Brassicogethes aeneus TaxID=1431903 RepID=A0A9P0FMI0_BRAAE|nr:unnamed protein product [Brassicogethes aeneus]